MNLKKNMFIVFVLIVINIVSFSCCSSVIKKTIEEQSNDSILPLEGAATIALNGELPTHGYFIATNAFPINSIVDIINIESGKGTRVIVAGKLNNHEFLVMVSQEVANKIDMYSGSINKIRMILNTDPLSNYKFN